MTTQRSGQESNKLWHNIDSRLNYLWSHYQHISWVWFGRISNTLAAQYVPRPFSSHLCPKFNITNTRTLTRYNFGTSAELLIIIFLDYLHQKNIIIYLLKEKLDRDSMVWKIFMPQNILSSSFFTLVVYATNCGSIFLFLFLFYTDGIRCLPYCLSATNCGSIIGLPPVACALHCTL